MQLTTVNLKGLNLNATVVPNLMECLSECADEYEVNNPLRLTHFLAQVCHESNGFRVMEENLNYSTPQRIMAVWPSRFKTVAFASQYTRNPEKLGNFVYANRIGNGDVESGDGYRYRGRGPIQITGKFNYTLVSNKMFGDDRLVKEPDLLKELKYGLRAAFIKWKDAGCNICADKDDVRTVTKKINGGFIGLNDRILWVNNWKKKLFQ